MPQITNPATGRKSCELPPYRHQRLRGDSPRHEFRDQLTEPGLDLVVETVTGCRPIALLAGELDR
jgi:hypothetical protein